MTAAQAFKKVSEKDRVVIGDNYFALLGWSKEGSSEAEPFFVSVSGDTAVELKLDGSFVQTFPSQSEGYFPFIERQRQPRKQQIVKIIEQLLKKVA